jgi:hypothetical protein
MAPSFVVNGTAVPSLCHERILPISLPYPATDDPVAFVEADKHESDSVWFGMSLGAINTF